MPPGDHIARKTESYSLSLFVFVAYIMSSQLVFVAMSLSSRFFFLFLAFVIGRFR